MFFRLLIISLFLSGCIQPKYAPNEKPNPQDLKSCPYKLINSGNCLSLDWEVPPTAEDFGQFLVNAKDEIDGDVSVFLWMPSMGHGSSPVTVNRIDMETYRVFDVFFSMPGDWEIYIQVKKNNEVKDQAVIPFTF